MHSFETATVAMLKNLKNAFCEKKNKKIALNVDASLQIVEHSLCSFELSFVPFVSQHVG